ncbi:MAG: L-aspartate oxidase [Brevundimonas sp.]|uniref:L-aspartate oxidase n=1 Tax=Brevundimonas sp. TaxID=1871086 RepID=UPI00271898FC|nr:L-aspartate oxidase [Brevundimonas sp.]MDO9587187.1 L-aspartate oxidase [Brevundimonas sp.]MDP3657173.1 L-aspartate oxidase [Brevundimonas sp.]MDZ4112910.1 L-aspartate oxidase [Brevundimonas sp.]
MSRTVRHDGPLIIGGGLAGLSAALEAGPRKVLVVTPAPLLQACSSAWAQGGVAAALSAGDDPALHAADTAAAGSGLVEAAAVEALTGDGRATVEWLARLGAPFDRDAAGGFVVSLEAAHSRARVARVGGDGAGRAILSALVTAVRAAPHIEVQEDGRLRSLIRDGAGRIRGAVIERNGRLVEVLAPAVVLATGGAGGLFARTTTPSTLLGEGMAAAWLAGAEILDPEFMQFHPTAIDVGLDPMPLATEALRGEGARLVDRDGAFLLGAAADADLQPRDVVARAVFAAQAEGRGAFLDCRAVGAHLAEEFPAVFAACMRAGLDPRETPIPVAAAAHYHMGGIAAGTDGRTSLPGLFAVGECAATGVHGANRLASNSLLEAAAFGRRTGRAAAGETSGGGETLPTSAAPDLTAGALQILRETMSRDVGVMRDAAGLAAALAVIAGLEADAPGALPLVAARLIAEAALERRESRGGHFRRDFPDAASVARHTRLGAQPQAVKSFARSERAA